VIEERFKVICPACGQQVEAIVRDGWVKGYCAVAKRYQDFPVEIQRNRETKSKMPGSSQTRDSRGRFVKGNSP